MSKGGPVPRAANNGADYFAALQKEWMRMHGEKVGLFTESMMVDNRPPLTLPNSELGMWQSLNLLRSTGDPRYWNDPEAQQMWTLLSQKFGAPAPWQPAVSYGAIMPSMTG